MPKGQWKQLRDQLVRLRASGKLLRDTDGSLIRDAAHPGESFCDYSFGRNGVMRAVRDWLRDAETMLLEAGRTGDVQRLDRIVFEFTGQSLARVAALSLRHFAPVESDLPDADAPGEFDPLYARIGFHLFLCTLVDEAAYYAKVSGASKRRLPTLDEEFWTREQLADFLGVKPASISKNVSEYRREHGRDPQWLRRLPGKVRGFKVKAKVYVAMMRRAGAPKPRRYRRSAAAKP